MQHSQSVCRFYSGQSGSPLPEWSRSSRYPWRLRSTETKIITQSNENPISINKIEDSQFSFEMKAMNNIDSMSKTHIFILLELIEDELQHFIQVNCVDLPGNIQESCLKCLNFPKFHARMCDLTTIHHFCAIEESIRW